MFAARRVVAVSKSALSSALPSSSASLSASASSLFSYYHNLNVRSYATDAAPASSAGKLLLNFAVPHQVTLSFCTYFYMHIYVNI